MGSQAADWVHEGMADEGKMTFGFRWAQFWTQSSGCLRLVRRSTFRHVRINTWFRFGMMLEWENHSVDSPRNGSLNTITLLPVNPNIVRDISAR